MRTVRMLVIGAWLIFNLASVVTPVSAQNGCLFQSPMADGRSVMDHQVAGGDLDKTYSGLHQVAPSHWPGTDTQGEIRSIFRMGGIVRFSGWDLAGGGWGVIIDGVAGCKGWTMAVWHMSSDPSSRIKMGEKVDGSTILGTHGHSGDLGDVADHNHVSVGYQAIEDPFHFTDDTVAKKVGGVYWIHPARVESGVLRQSPSWNPLDGFQSWGSCLVSLSVVLAFLLWVGPLGARGAGAIVSGLTYALSKLLWAVLYGVSQATRQAQRIGCFWGLFFTIFWSVVLLFIGLGGLKLDFQKIAQGNWPSIVWTTQRNCEVSSKFPEEVRQWCNLITAHARENGLDPNLVAAVIQHESAGDPLAYSVAGATGLMQVMPKDGISASFQCKNGPCFADRPSISELQNPEFNILTGTDLLAGNVERLGSLREGLLAYGPRDVGYSYADLILGTYEEANK